jgi:hypothetical protein
MIAPLLAILLSAHATLVPVVEWDFSSTSPSPQWIANGDLSGVQIENGTLRARAVGNDPFLSCLGLSIPATPWQYLVFKIKADHPGNGELFWSGVTDGAYGGLTQEKKTSFHISGNNQWEEISIFPFWQTEGTIRQLRLDVYDGACFELDSIQLLDWGRASPPQSGVKSWYFGGDLSAWSLEAGPEEYFAPQLNLSVEDTGWVTVQLRSTRFGVGSILWGSQGVRGLQSEDFQIDGDGRMHPYNIQLAGIPSWKSPIVAFGIHLPREIQNETSLESIQLGDSPRGPAWVEARYFGFADGIHRSGQPCRLLAQITNRGGATAERVSARLVLPEGVRLVEETADKRLPGIEIGSLEEVSWAVMTDQPGEATVTLVVESAGEKVSKEARLRFMPEMKTSQAEYVPEPRPVKTDLDVCMYYFPGWDSDGKWDCIRQVAPNRKPTLGYYDEGNPECVDWQIKWAAENGISCFLVDWYWNKGTQSLTHWFEAYRKAHYRNQLKVAIMWANHNPLGSHSPEDWRNVTREWIERYFPLESYFRIDDKPAIFIWDPSLVREDLKGSEGVRTALAQSQEMARSAGYKGISFIAMEHHRTSGQAKTLLGEGYRGATNYHEWGDATGRTQSMKRARYEDVVTSVPNAWEAQDAVCGDLTYYPIVDTGWDARPWHGDKTLVIEGRTPQLFERLLGDAKGFCRQRNKPFVVLGPANEWGEGSYVEPCTEFSFEMYESIRKVFASGDPSSWPDNLGPADVGRGPYDFPKRLPVTCWTFDNGLGDWKAMMNLGKVRAEDGMVRFTTASADPALMVGTPGVAARDWSKVVVRMQIIGNLPEKTVAQVFWSPEGGAASEATSARFLLNKDGALHEYELNLSSHPRWKGRIAALRFDPCETAGAEVLLDEFRFEK